MNLRARELSVLGSKIALGFLTVAAVFGGGLARAFPEGSDAQLWLLGARTTTVTAVVVAVIAISVGLTLGAAAALGPRVVDSLLSLAIEMAAGIPSVIVALIVYRVAPTPGFLSVSVTLGLLRGLQTAKVVRRELITLMATEFSLAATALGSSRTRLFRTHLLPHVVSAALASATLTAAAVVGLEAALSFLGLASPGPSWGAMIAQGALTGAPGVAALAALGLAVALVALHVVGTRFAARLGVGRSFV